MFKKFLSLLMILLTLHFNIFNTYAYDVGSFVDEKPKIDASSAIVMELNTGDILYSYNEHEKQYPASITKILTTLIALEYNHPNDTIVFSDNAIWGIDRSSSNLAIDVKEELNMTDALYCVMLASANDAAMGVAEHIGGSIENFAKIMNERAKEAGALNSNFVNPHGLHDENHYTTAYDMAMISKAAYSIEEFRKICGTFTYQVPPTNKQPEIRYLANYHEMLSHYSQYYYPDCIGGKTGWTDKAQSTLVTFAKHNDLELVCVVMHETGNTKYNDTKKLLDYCFENFKIHEIEYEEQTVLPVYYFDDNNTKINLGNINLKLETPLKSIVIPKNAVDSDIICKLNVPECLYSPIASNEIVGSADFYYKDNLLESINLIAEKDLQYIPTVSKNSVLENTATTEKNEKNSILPKIIVLIFIVLLLFIIYIKYKQYLIKKRRAKRSKYKTPKNLL